MSVWTLESPTLDLSFVCRSDPITPPDHHWAARRRNWKGDRLGKRLETITPGAGTGPTRRWRDPQSRDRCIPPELPETGYLSSSNFRYVPAGLLRSRGDYGVVGPRKAKQRFLSSLSGPGRGTYKTPCAPPTLRVWRTETLRFVVPSQYRLSSLRDPCRSDKSSTSLPVGQGRSRCGST